MNTTRQYSSFAERIAVEEVLANASQLVSALVSQVNHAGALADLDELLPCLQQPGPIEAQQHWIVSPWLADRLEQVGAMVARDIRGLDIWGRSEAGIALEDDADIQAVVDGLAGGTKEG